MTDLPDTDLELLAFERQWWRYPGMKEQAIREQFRIPPTAYYQRLNRIISSPEALAADPMLVRRLRRVRAARRGTVTHD